MPDEPEKPQNLPGRHRPHLSDLSRETTEEDLWDLEQVMETPSPEAPAKIEPVPRDDPKKPLKPIEDAGERSIAEASEVSQEPRSKPGKPSVSSIQTRSGNIAPIPKDAPETGIPKASRPNGPKPLDPKLPTSESAPESEPSKPEPAKKKPASTPDIKTSRPSGKGEKIGLTIFVAVFLGLATWWIIGLFSSIETSRIGDDQPDFPAKGANLTIDNAETYWRQPVRDGANPDVARSEVEFIPVLKITIDESKSGVLRAIYRNEQGDFVGDSISQSFANGVFDLNANPEVEFPATDGFLNPGEFNGYRVGDDRWIVEVFEGPSIDASGSEFKLIFTAPISTNRQ